MAAAGQLLQGARGDPRCSRRALATKEGEAKLVEVCDYPLTAARCTSRVITDLCVLDPAGDHFVLVELAPGVSADEVRAKTGARVAG